MSNKTNIIHTIGDWNHFIDSMAAGRIIVLTDTNTSKHCLPLFESKYLRASQFTHWEIEAGEANKTLAQAEQLWTKLMHREADRSTILICLGGGMLTDLGGFVGSAYKRGIRTVYVPTTNLAMTDAAIGGKTGVNFGGVKNQIGTFHKTEAVLVDPEFLNTLPAREIESGFAETIKHALIADASLWQTLLAKPLTDCANNAKILLHSMNIKQRIVESDSHDFGVRQSLNLGHTIGHAIEAISHESENPLLHGEAVIFGMLAELYISKECAGLAENTLNEISSYLTSNYRFNHLNKMDKTQMMQHMLNDKKNTKGRITFSLISNIGEPTLGIHVSDEIIMKSIDFAQHRLTNEIHP